LKHEQALERFISAILKPGATNKFLADFTAFQKRIAFYGMANGLAQTLLKIASPGVPDFYQGSDLWDFRLVDPDNRRQVNFEERQQALTKLRALNEAPSPSYVEVARNWRDGSIKLYVIWKALQQRAQHPDLYSDGEFLTLDVRGKRAEHISAFARRLQKVWSVIVVPRWLARAGFPLPPQGPGKFWGDTTIQLPKAAPTEWKNAFTNEVVQSQKKNGSSLIRMEDLAQFPVALLTGEVSRKGGRSQR
jgi:(1->4)-alpha-D-glucan 1-alpha-D-glucosylmutase